MNKIKYRFNGMRISRAKWILVNWVYGGSSIFYGLFAVIGDLFRQKRNIRELNYAEIVFEAILPIRKKEL